MTVPEGCNDPSPIGSTRVAVLLDALDGVPLSDAERAPLTWLAGFERRTVGNIAAVITRPRRTREGER